MEKSEEKSTSDGILNQEFFDTIKKSKKINIKTQKIQELSKYISSQGDILSPEIKSKIPDLYNLLLINLNENNNNYVLAQMELIQVLGNILKGEDNFKNFIRQSLSKLFDKFYLSNPKINQILVKMFSEFIEYKILTIKDYYQYIENIPLEDEDNYRINILTFLYENIQKGDTVLLNNIPKSINEIIKKLVNDNESDISETASKILNILINRDRENELNKKKENLSTENKLDVNKENPDDKGGTSKVSTFVKNIVSAIKQNVEENKIDNKDNNINNSEKKDNKDNNIKYEGEIKQNNNNSININNNIEKKLDEINNDRKEEEIKNDKINNEKKKEKNEQEANNIDNEKNKGKDEPKDDKKINEEHIEKEVNIEEIKDKKNNIEDKKEEIKKEEEIKEEEKKEEIKEEEKKGEIKDEEKKEEIKKESKKEEKKLIYNQDNKINEDEKNESNFNKEINKDNNIENKEMLSFDKKKESINENKTEEKQNINNEKTTTENKIENIKPQIQEENKIKEDENEVSEIKPKEEIKDKSIEIKPNEEKKEDNNNNEKSLEVNKNENEIKKQENISETKNTDENIEHKEENNKNDNIQKEEMNIKEDKKEEQKTENIDNINKENKNIQSEQKILEETNENKPIEENQKEKLNEETKVEEREKPNQEIKLENKVVKEKHIEKENNAENRDENINVDNKKEEKHLNKKDSKDINIKKEENNTAKEEQKKEEENKKSEKTEAAPGKKKTGTGIKSKISKFRKNMKNKNKGGGFEFELVVEKKKDDIKEENDTDKNIDKENEKINENNNKESIKGEIKETKVEEKQAGIKEVEVKSGIKNINDDLKEKNKILNEEKNNEKSKEENPKEEKKEIKLNEEIKEEKPKEEKKEIIQEDKPKEDIKKEIPQQEIKSIKEEKENQPQEKNKLEENKKEDSKLKSEINEEITPEKNNTQENPPERKEGKSLGINQESLNEFEKKLQLALEQEEKDKNNMESLVENTGPTPIKQKKEDPKFDEIKSKLGKEIVDSLFSPKWEVKKKGFELIKEFLNNNTKDNYNINDLIEYMKLKLKNYKETNFNINREAINVYIDMINKKIIPKDSLVSIILAYHEKLSDIKLKDNLIELINNSFDIIEPNNILKQIITKISKKNNAKLLTEYATLFGKIVDDYDVKDLPNKDIIDFCKVLANNSNPQVRTSAISLLCILYKYLGKDVKTLTRDIKESTLKLIDAELDKVKVINPKEISKKKKVASVIENGPKSGGGGGGSNDLIPPQDISKKITPAIIKQLSGKWAEKKEACDAIEKILVSANMRILPNGLNTLMTNIKKKLPDSNKNFVKLLVSLLSKLIEAMKSGFKQWAKPIALALIPNLADKNQLMRNECQNCFDKWVEFAGFDSLVIHFPKFLTTDNVEMRIEIMNFFKKYKDKFNKSTGESVYKDMMNPLLICLQDRSSNVRNLAEDIIKISLVYNPINNYYKKIEDFKPAIAKTLKQILDKIKKEVNTETTQENNNPSETDNSSQISHQETNEKQNQNQNNSTINTNNSKTNEKPVKNPGIKSSNKKLSIQTDTPLKTETSQDDSDKNESITDDNISNFNTISNINSASLNSKKVEKDLGKTIKKIPAINVKRATKPKRKLSEDDLVNPLGTAMNKQMPASSVEHLASNSTILKKELKSFKKNISQVMKPNTAVFLINVKVIPNKAKRYEKDKRTKFNLETVSKDYFIKLKEQCKGLFTEQFSKKIFSDDFRKQVEAYKDMKSQIDKKINIPIYYDNLDLILKIIGIKIINNLNPTLMKNFFEFLDSLYTVLFENKYKLNDTESNIIINILIDKLSLNNNTLREHLISLLNKYIEFMDTNKIMVTVINVALNKNNKIKTDILDITIDLVSQKKLNISSKTYAKLLCKFLPFYENVIRTRILPLFQEIYSNIGEELWTMIEISEKDKEFLQENLCADGDEEEEDEEGEEKEDNEEEDENVNENENNGDENQINDNENNINDSINKKKTNSDTEKKILGNKNGKLTKEDLEFILDNLLIDDPNDKLNTIIIIHENICGKFEQNKEVLIPNIDKIISTFKIVSHKLFYMKDLNSIPIKFAKYLSIVFCKLASNKELISNLSYNVLLDISRELLRYLLINGLDKIGEKQEGNIIFKSINSTMLRILENCDTTFVITALLELIKEFHDKDDKNLVNLAIKCLLKTTHNLSENIDNIKIDKILLQIHLLLLSLQKNNKDMNKKTQTDALIINTVKNIVNDFVQLKKEKILEDYSKSVKNHQINDKYLLKWIKTSLEKV